MVSTCRRGSVLCLHSSPVLAPHPCQPSASPLSATGLAAHLHHLFALGLHSIRTLTTHFQSVLGSRDMSWGSVRVTAFPGPLTQVLREENGSSSGGGSPPLRGPCISWGYGCHSYCPSRPSSLLISGQQLQGKAGQARSINGPDYRRGRSAGPRAEQFQAKPCAVRETDVSLGRACLMLH